MTQQRRWGPAPILASQPRAGHRRRWQRLFGGRGWLRSRHLGLPGSHLGDAGGHRLAGNKGRLASQRGVAGATAYSRALGQRLMQAGDAPVEGGTTPTDDTPPDLAGAQRQLTVLQWVIPGLTGTALVLNALMGNSSVPSR